MPFSTSALKADLKNAVLFVAVIVMLLIPALCVVVMAMRGGYDHP